MREVTITLGSTEVFAQRTSAKQSEFNAAGMQGIKPDYCFSVITEEYNNEETLIYDGVKYVIYRTYEKGDRIELYVTKKAGVR